MSLYSKSELAQLKIIEDEVNGYLHSSQFIRNGNPKHNNGFNRKLEMVLENALLPSKTVHIVWNDAARTPFIMSITPNIKELYNKSQELVKIMDIAQTKSGDAKTEFVRKWAEIKEWFIEIDTRVLTKGNNLCVDDGGQFVALLCHEVGHVMMENPMHLLYQYRINSLKFTTLERLMISKSLVVRAILLPMFVHTSQFMVVVDNIHDGKAKELAADRYVPDEYKGALVSYIDNHILLNPDTNGLLMDQDTYDKEQAIAIKLPKESISMLKGRKEALNQQIRAQYQYNNGSIFQQKLMKFIGRNLTGYDPETDKSINAYLYENSFDRDFIMESAIAKRMVTEASKVTPRELDILAIQVDDIETPEDRMYLLHRTYDYMEAIQSELNKQNKIKSGVYSDKRLDQLNGIRDKIMAKHIDPRDNYLSRDRHAIFVNYPKGYEG